MRAAFLLAVAALGPKFSSKLRLLVFLPFLIVSLASPIDGHASHQFKCTSNLELGSRHVETCTETKHSGDALVFLRDWLLVISLVVYLVEKSKAFSPASVPASVSWNYRGHGDAYHWRSEVAGIDRVDSSWLFLGRR